MQQLFKDNLPLEEVNLKLLSQINTNLKIKFLMKFSLLIDNNNNNNRTCLQELICLNNTKPLIFIFNQNLLEQNLHSNMIKELDMINHKNKILIKEWSQKQRNIKDLKLKEIMII